MYQELQAAAVTPNRQFQPLFIHPQAGIRETDFLNGCPGHIQAGHSRPESHLLLQSTTYICKIISVSTIPDSLSVPIISYFTLSLNTGERSLQQRAIIQELALGIPQIRLSCLYPLKKAQSNNFSYTCRILTVNIISLALKLAAAQVTEYAIHTHIYWKSTLHQGPLKS